MLRSGDGAPCCQAPSLARRAGGGAGSLRRLFILLCVAISAFSLDAAAPPRDTPARHTRDGLDKRRPCWSSDGKHLAFARHESDGIHIWQYVWEPGAASPPRRLLGDYDEPHFDATFARDGTRLLLTAVRFIGTQGNLDILGVNADGSGRKM